jgi:hypothetical protein
MKTVRPALLLVIFAALCYCCAGDTDQWRKRFTAYKSGMGSGTDPSFTVGSFSFFGAKSSQYVNKDTGLDDATTIWDVQGLVSLNYGLGKHFDLTLTPIAYQDVHQGATEEYPWDTFLALKLGSLGPKASSLNYGFELGARFPTGERHNVIYEDYTAGTIEVGLNSLLSFAYDPLYPEDALNVHANLGYWHHNDAGEKLIPSILHPENNVIHPSQHVKYGLGFVIPTADFNYGLEIVWKVVDPKTAARCGSRENYAYINARCGL